MGKTTPETPTRNKEKGAFIMVQRTIKTAKPSLNNILLERLEELKESTNSEIIKFPSVFMKLCRNFSITKDECWSVLFSLRDSGFIEIVPYHGIIIKNKENKGFMRGSEKNN